MKNIFFIYGLFFLILNSACHVAKYLPPGEKLFRGSTIKVERETGVKASARSLRKQLNQVVRPKPNKFILGQPYKVWWWYAIGEPKRERGLKKWLRDKLGEPPVLSSRVNARATAENMTAFLENNGYFHSSVTGDTVNQRSFVKAIYEATVLPQYKIKSISWVNDSSDLLRALSSGKRRSILKVGRPYSLSDIQAERDRLDLFLKTKGYYYFNPDYILVYADSTIGNHGVNLFLNIKNTIPENAKHPFTINKITVFPNYTLLNPPPDTSRVGLIDFDGLLIRDTLSKFRPELFRRTITYRPNSLYDSRQQNTTLNRFINLGTFKFVKNRFEQVKNATDSNRLNVYYYLTPAKQKSFQAQIDAFSKENRYVGSQVSVNWRNRNTFRGGELFTIKTYGGFEVSFKDSLKENNNFRIGSEATLNFPRYVIPFLKLKESNLYPPRTQLLLGYEYFIKQGFYAKNIFRFQYEFSWKESSNKQHVLSPVSITYLNASNIKDAFFEEVIQNPSILLNVYSEAILGSFYSYTYNTLNPRAKNQWYFNGSIDLSGNIAGLITGARSFREKSVLNAPFAQYVKTDIDLRYSRALGNKMRWANRFQLGVGIPYNNSSLLPFSKQYVIGGSNSIRGFPVRTVGPGSYLPTIDDLRFFQIIGGDYKFLVNSELRFPIVGRFNGAIFADVGNIWTKDTLLFGKAGQLKKDWYKELAVASGIGVRFDASVLLIRLDLGIPLRKPFLPENERWVFDKINLGDKIWRRENLILNIAIGYPF